MSVAAGALALAASVAALAQDPQLLEPERAFAFSARGLDPQTIEARFSVADGYYLYRDKLKFKVEPDAIAGQPALPSGHMKDDPFFGKVETYRGELVFRLPLSSAAPGKSVNLSAESQGCADAGVCYPAQLQKLSVPLPAAGAGAGPLVEAAPAKRSWFK